MFGLNHNVKLIASDLTSSVDYVDPGGGAQPEFIYERSPQVDHITVDDFRYGQWYSNAQQIREYADKHNLPVLVEFGSSACPPCEQFHANVFSSEVF